MLGWEYPPHITGGLAAATAGVVRGLLMQDVSIELLVPVSADVESRPGLTVHGVVSDPLPPPTPVPASTGSLAFTSSTRWLSTGLGPPLPPVRWTST